MIFILVFSLSSIYKLWCTTLLWRIEKCANDFITGFLISLAALAQSCWDVQMSSCLFPALDLFEDTAIGMYFAGYLQLKHFPFFPCLLLMILSINQIIPAPPPQTIFRQIGFLIWFPFHQIKSVTRMMRGNIANTLGQQILLPGAICQWCQMTVFLSFLSHRKICTFSFFTVQRNIDLPHYCNSYNHSCHNQTYCKIIRLIRITLQ